MASLIWRVWSVGSEGTLALTTQATLRTVPIPKQRGVALLFFDRVEAAATAAIEAQSLGLAACDLIDRRILSLARDIDERYAPGHSSRRRSDAHHRAASR